MKFIKAQDLKPVQKSDGVIIDIRSGKEHAEKHLAMAHILAPLDTLDPRTVMEQQGLGADATAYLLCLGGIRAQKAADKFAAAGYPNAIVIEGGLRACEAAGQKIVTAPANGFVDAISQKLKALFK